MIKAELSVGTDNNLPKGLIIYSSASKTYKKRF